MNNYQHLIETTLSDYTQRTYTLGVGYSYEDLTEEEKTALHDSEKYEKCYSNERNSWLVKEAREDFEKLRNIPNLPKEAIDILKNWTFRDGDEDEDEDE